MLIIRKGQVKVRNAFQETFALRLARNSPIGNAELSRNVRAVSEANRRDSFGWLGPQEFAFDTAT